MRQHLFTLALLASCRGDELPVEAHELGSLEYEVPATWQSIVRDRGVRHVVEWTPKENTRKESITLVHSEPLPALAKAGPAAVMHHLAQAQHALRGTFEPAQRFTSRHGFAGARIEGSFTPAGETRRYTRTHTVVLADDRVVHVLYTAPLGTSNRDVLDAVINSLQRKGA